jgi:hypothetical protein
MFGDFQLVIDKDTGYFNAAKLCAMGGKDFFDWKRLSRTKSLLACLRDQCEDGKEIIYEVRTSNKGLEKQITGQYVQQDLILDIASWISPKFYFRCNKIVIDYFTSEYVNMDKTERTSKIKELELKMEEMEIENQQQQKTIAEKTDKIDELKIMLEAAEEARKADAKAAEEARKADAKAAEEARKADAKAAEEARKAAEEARKADARRAEAMLRNMGINLMDVRCQNDELLEEVHVVQKKLNIAVEDRAPQPSQNRKRERFVLFKRNDEDFPYFTVRAQNCRVQTVLKEQKLYFGDLEMLMDIDCHPNSKTLFVRIKDELKTKGVEFHFCKVSLKNSSISERELVETMKKVNDEKLNV